MEIVKAREAIKKIKDRDYVAISGYGSYGLPEKILSELENKYLEEKSPKDLNIIFCAAIGNGTDNGLEHFSHEGQVASFRGSYFGVSQGVADLIIDNKVKAYGIPQGIMIRLLRASVRKDFGVITDIGLGTFVDPLYEGCSLNQISEPVVKRVRIDKIDRLLYESFPVNVAVIKGSRGDARGNISLKDEPVRLEQLIMAQAAKNNGGIVIAEIDYFENRGIDARNVDVPGFLVDYMVIKEKPDQMNYNYFKEYEPEKILNDNKAFNIIVKRACKELKKNTHTKFGLGIPEMIPYIVAQEDLKDYLFTTDSGVIGGLCSQGRYFGTSYGAEAIIDQGYQFDYYYGGGLEQAYLGMAEIDPEGNVNASKFSGRIMGPGGFIDISQKAKNLFFLGTFTTGGLEIDLVEGEMKILKEGKKKKFVNMLEQITFNGKKSIVDGLKVKYITERAVFELTEKGLLLTEIMPGIDIERDILNSMDFVPQIDEHLYK